jgi:ABC-type polar amino acid transport system ATPase subunit
MSAICLDAARYRYVSGTVVGPVDLTVRRGELVLLSGPSGGGKSTVLRLAAGLLGSGSQGERSGRVALDGEDPVGRARPIAWVGQEPDDAVIGTTLLAEAAFGAECAGLDAPEAHARDALRRVGLADLAGASPSVLSGGQRQRLAIAAGPSTTQPKFMPDVPAKITTPDTVETRIGTLRFKDGAPDPATVQLAYDQIDFTRGIDAFVKGMSATSVYALCRGLEEAGRKLPPEMVAEAGYTFDSGLQAMERLIYAKRRPTAVFAGNDEMATGAYVAVRKAGLRIPEDISIVGFDDTPIAGRLWPAMTTVRLPIREMGRAAARLLLDQAAGNAPSEMISFSPEIVVRESTAPPPR